MTDFWVIIRVTLRLAIYAIQCALVMSLLRLTTSDLLFNWILTFIVLMYHPLGWEDRSVVYNCCWSSPSQSFSGLTSVGLVTTFYCLKFETPPTWRARSLCLYPPGKVARLYLRHWIPFSSPPTTPRAAVKVFNSSTQELTWFTNGILT
jgi:hypothetical protein